MSKSVKRSLINTMKHVQYDHEMARHMNKRRVIQDQEESKYYKKYKKFEYYEEE